MEGDRPCPTCGQLMPFGQSECSERKGTLWSPERESLVLLAFPALVAFFVVTGFAARAYHSKEKHLADEWYARGQADLGADRPAPVLDGGESASGELRRIEALPEEYFLVSGDGQKWSCVGRDILEHLAAGGEGDVALKAVLSDVSLPFLHPDQSLEWALRQIDNWPLLPVVHRLDFGKIEGVISLDDILKVYRGGPKGARLDAPR